MRMLPWFQWTTIPLGPLTIQVWGLFVALGMVLSAAIISQRARKQGMDSNKMLDLVIWILIAGFIGARVFHITFYEPAFFLAHPLEMIQIWHGGLSSFGGVFGAILVLSIWLRRHKMLKEWKKIADVLSFGAVFGWIVGRIGCFMIHDHLGAESNCPLALITPTGSRLDMALLEIIGMLPLAILFMFMRKKPLPNGWYTAVLFIYYGVLRFFLDFWRATDIAGADARYLGLTPGQYCAILLVLCGGYVFRKGKTTL